MVWAQKTKISRRTSCWPNTEGSSLWRAGFLPSEYQGVPFNSSETDPEKMIRDLRNKRLDPQAQRKQLDLIQAMNPDYRRVLARTHSLRAA